VTPMRGYFAIMNCTEPELHGNGEKVAPMVFKRTLWQPRGNEEVKVPLWHLRVHVLKDQEGRGDCPSRIFTFKSLHHLTHAENQLEAEFGSVSDFRKCGIETPNAMGDRVNDGRCENITIEYDSETAVEGWNSFLGRLKSLQDEWQHESELSLL